MPDSTEFRTPLPEGLITVLFTDIVDSSRLKNSMEGDTAARRDAKFRSQIKEPHDKIILDCIKESRGHKVKSTGDGYLFTFTDAEEAVLCALKIQNVFRVNAVNTPLGPLQIRIGLHTGIASPTDDDYVASAVDKAAQIQSQAAPGEVFVSHETCALVERLKGVEIEEAGVFDLKGLDSQKLYRVSRSGDAQSANPSTSRSPVVSEIQNPYEFALTANTKTFKGRELEIQELLESIATGTHTAVFGLQRMGKTSLIEEGLRKELESRSDLNNSVFVVKIDMQRLGGAQVMYRDFVYAIIEGLVEKISSLGLGRNVQNLRRTHDILSSGQYQRGDRTEFFSVFAKLLSGLSNATHRRAILFIDEFSEVRKVIERNKSALHNNPSRTSKLLPHDMYIDVPFIHHLSSLLKDPQLKKQITFIVSVRPFISEYDEREGLQLLKLMKPITLYHLDEKAAKQLITEPLSGQVTYERGTVDYLYWLTAGHPYLLQFILKLIIDKIIREGRAMVTPQDIKTVEERMVTEGPAFDAPFAVLISDYSVDEVTHPKESLLGKGLLALIAYLGRDQEEAWVLSHEIFDALERYKTPIGKTSSLLSQLTRTKIVEEASVEGTLKYRLSIPLLRQRFLRQNLYLKYFH
jgi:class 3 adenylate cyclase